MEVDAPGSGPAAIGGIGGSFPSAAAFGVAPTPQFSAERQSVEPPVNVGVVADTHTPSGATAEDVETSATAGFREIADFITACTAPSIISSKWSFLDEEDPRLRVEMETLEFVEALKQEYGAEVLTELGLYERVGDELRLPSWLDGDAPLYVIIDAHNFTVSFSCDSEFLFPIARTALDNALQRNSPESTQAPVTLFVVESQDAVEIMQRLRLPAVSCEGLESLGRHDIHRLFEGDHRSDLGWRYYLLLVDFDVAGLANRPLAGMEEVVNRLADAQQVYSIDPSRRFGVCRPTESEFRELELATAFKDPVQIRDVFEKWSAAANSVSVSVSVSSWRAHFNSATLSFSAASAALIHALQRSNDLARRAEVLVALPAYRAAGKGVVMRKFYHDIDRASDPFDHVDSMAAAAYAETFLDSDPLVRAGEAVLAGQNPPSVGELQDELFEQRQRCIVELRRIRRDRKAKR